MRKVLFLMMIALVAVSPCTAFAAPIKILIVPGHDSQFSGAKFRTVREADLTLSLARKIALDLQSDKNVSVTVIRNGSGYIKPFALFMKNNSKEVWDFVHGQKKISQSSATSSGTAVTVLPHANANAEVAYRLFAVNKWAADQGFDLVVHIHFNDEWPRPKNRRGQYSGYTVYAPGKGMLNQTASGPLAEFVGTSLASSFHKSTMPIEAKHTDRAGVALDNKLIALGAYGTSAIPTILTEYGYIYEPAISGTSFSKTAAVMARETVQGIEAYLADRKN